MWCLCFVMSICCVFCRSIRYESEIEMSNCPYCEVKIDREYNFCLNCDRQIICIHCNYLLVPNKTICSKCGEPLVRQPQSQMNEFTLEEKQTRNSAYRHINGKFSDSAFGQIASLFGGMPQYKPISRLVEVNSHQKQNALLSSSNSQQTDIYQDSEIDPQTQQEDANAFNGLSNKASSNNQANKYFRQTGKDEIIPKQVDFKGVKRRDQQQRFIILYIWAYYEIFTKPVPTQKYIVDTAKKISLHNSNFKDYFEETANEFLIEIDGQFELNPSGEQFIQKITKEMNDSSVEEGFVYWKKTKTRTRRGDVTKEDEQQVNEWVDLVLDLGQFDIRTLDSASKYASFAIWVITKRLGVASAVKPQMAYLYLTKKFTTVPVKQRSFKDALSRSYNANKFSKNADGLYYLTEHGEQEVESWLNM